MNCSNQCNVVCGGPNPPAPMTYPQMFPRWGEAWVPAGTSGYFPGPTGYSAEPTGFSDGPTGAFNAGGSGCGGSNVPCAPYGSDVPRQARARKQRPPSSGVPARKIGVDNVSCTTLASPLASLSPYVTDDAPQDPDEIPDHQRFDVFTLAFGAKPGSNKPARMLVTLKTPKVLAARLNTSTVATQVGYHELGLTDPTKRREEPPRESAMSRKSRKSAKSHKSKLKKNKK